MNYKLVAVHDGNFHSDDVFAIAVLKLIHPKLKYIRSRDQEKLSKVDARIDVGFSYDPRKGNFDHHQKEGAGKRENNIPYAAIGLIWKQFGKELVSQDWIFECIDKKLIQHLDAHDNGLKTFSVKDIEPYKIDDAINALNPQWPDESNSNKSFKEAVKFAMLILKGEINKAEGMNKARNTVLKTIKESKSKDYIILKEFVPFKEVATLETKLKFVVYYDKEKENWRLRTVEKDINGFAPRKPLPKEWAGLENEELAKVTCIKDVIFSHKNRITIVAKSKESILKLLDLALKYKE